MKLLKYYKTKGLSLSSCCTGPKGAWQGALFDTGVTLKRCLDDLLAVLCYHNTQDISMIGSIGDNPI
ncbi:hypothetical protein ACFLU4_00410 [Chloroflexota bacterium]